MFKSCTSCHTEKPLTDFRRNRRAGDGYQSWCKSCARDHHKSQYITQYGHKYRDRNNQRRESNAAKLLEKKLLMSCVGCGINDPECLDFHHKDPNTKVFSVGGGTTRSWAQIEEELTKCVCVCANCHRKIHAGTMVL